MSVSFAICERNRHGRSSKARRTLQDRRYTGYHIKCAGTRAGSRKICCLLTQNTRHGSTPEAMERWRWGKLRMELKCVRTRYSARNLGEPCRQVFFFSLLRIWILSSVLCRWNFGDEPGRPLRMSVQLGGHRRCNRWGASDVCTDCTLHTSHMPSYAGREGSGRRAAERCTSSRAGQPHVAPLADNNNNKFVRRRSALIVFLPSREGHWPGTFFSSFLESPRGCSRLPPANRTATLDNTDDMWESAK